MKRRVVVIAVVVTALLLVGMGVATAIGAFSPSNETWHVEKEKDPAGAITPEETHVTVRAQKDGTLKVTTQLVFDTPKGSEDPVTWQIGGTRIGWESSDRDTQYGVVPTVSDVEAHMMKNDSSGDLGDELDVSHEEATTDAEKAFGDPEEYTLTAPGDGWSTGRHAVELTYTLDDVHVSVDDQDLLVLPLMFPQGPEKAVAYRSVDVGTGNKIMCLATNVVFDPEPGCEGFKKSGLSSGDHRLSWIESPGGVADAIAFEAPDSVTSDPEPVEEREAK